MTHTPSTLKKSNLYKHYFIDSIMKSLNKIIGAGALALGTLIPSGKAEADVIRFSNMSNDIGWSKMSIEKVCSCKRWKRWL